MSIEQKPLVKNIKRSPSESFSFIHFMKIVFKGISQVMLVDNTGAGIIIFFAIAIASIPVAVTMLLAVTLGTVIAFIGQADRDVINKGLFGFNPALISIALMIFLDGSYDWIIAIIAGAIASVSTAAFIHIFKGIDIPYLTFPFISLTWIILLATYHLPILTIHPTLEPTIVSEWSPISGGSFEVFSAFTLGVSQVFFIEHVLTGILIVIAMFWVGWQYGLYTMIASVIGFLTAYFIGGDVDLISTGFFGYNAVLTLIAVSLVFKNNKNKYAFATGIFGCMLTVFVTLSMSTFLQPYGLPVLTIAFVLTTWLLLAARKVLPNI
ncbi:MAG TPA: urea transporter [Bacillota bacterium]|nr:urea transporter [Bacillota bacterium]